MEQFGLYASGYDDLLNVLQFNLRNPQLYYVENSGIGHYEAWGMTGFDKGQDFVVYVGPEDFVVEFSGSEESEPRDDETFTIPHELHDVRLRVSFESLKRFSKWPATGRAYLLCTVEQLRG